MKRTLEYVNKLDNQNIYCKSCSATYDIHLPKCPYCGEVNEYGDELSYQEHLETIQDDMEEMIDDSLEGATDEMVQRGRGALKYFIIIGAAILSVIILALVAITLKDKKEAREAKEEILWERQAYAQMDSLYEAKDYDGLLRYMEDFYSDPDHEKHTLYNWKHIEFLSAYMDYKYMCVAVENASKYPEDIKMTKQSVLLYALELKNENWEAKYTTVKSVSKSEYELIMTYVSEADDILLNHLGLSKEEVDDIISETTYDTGSSILSSKKVYAVADELTWTE